VSNFEATREKGKVLFKEPAVFIEKYIERARHIEVQVFGNGKGHVIHAGERECSVQRRHQKIIEEAPCALFASAKGQKVRKAICDAAVALCKTMDYRSAGTVEFVLDDQSPNLDFYFLELNARIQ
jgi:acetyl/propionyl-CoA carboxylase alpha subunit